MNPFWLRYRFLFLGILLWLIAGILYLVLRHGPDKPAPVSLSFYSWKNRFSLDSTHYALLEEYKVKHLRVKLFELGWNEYLKNVEVNNRLYSYSYNNYASSYFMENKLTPVVFLDNALFYKVDSARIREMAGMVKRAMQIHVTDLVIYQENIWHNYWDKLYFSLEMNRTDADSLSRIYDAFRQNIVSYEFDCDWTEKTRDKYFYFLKNVRDSLQKPVESTLRLHQYKYREKMGIPPAEAVNLMCYNMGDFKSLQETNSIFNKKILKEYMIPGQEVYPLPMNVAFPSFAWYVVFRNNRFYKLIPEMSLNKEDLERRITCCGVRKTGANSYEIDETYHYEWSEPALVKGDKIRLEKVDSKELGEMYRYLTEDLNLKISELIIFDLNNTVKMKDFDDLAKNFTIQ